MNRNLKMEKLKFISQRLTDSLNKAIEHKYGTSESNTVIKSIQAFVLHTLYYNVEPEHFELCVQRFSQELIEKSIDISMHGPNCEKCKKGENHGN